MIDTQAFAAFTAVAGFMFLADGKRFTLPVDSALHLESFSVKVFPVDPSKAGKINIFLDRVAIFYHDSYNLNIKKEDR